jgi:hypothetical protein
MSDDPRDLGPVGALKDGRAGWVEPAALHAVAATADAPAHLAVHPDASALIGPTQSHTLRVHRHGAGLLADRSHCRGHEPTPSDEPDLIPAFDLTPYVTGPAVVTAGTLTPGGTSTITWDDQSPTPSPEN